MTDHAVPDPEGIVIPSGNWCSSSCWRRSERRRACSRMRADQRQRRAGCRRERARRKRLSETLPGDAIVFLLPSRYCETDRMPRLRSRGSCSAAPLPAGGGSKLICDFVHHHLTFGYAHARPTRTALRRYQERVGVCRDFPRTLGHRILPDGHEDIPARYCTGFIWAPTSACRPVEAPMDFSGWFEAYLENTTAAGTRSTLGTTCRASGGSSSRAVGTRRTSPSARRSAPTY